ncbi:hypothetical protein HK149_05250, partial [Streptococcus agalactiae]|nr:hypothetical protein [Streptococcus agalactiae]
VLKMVNLILVLIAAVIVFIFVFLAVKIHDAPLLADDEMTVISSPKHDHDEHHSQKAA